MIFLWFFFSYRCSNNITLITIFTNRKFITPYSAFTVTPNNFLAYTHANISKHYGVSMLFFPNNIKNTLKLVSKNLGSIKVNPKGDHLFPWNIFQLVEVYSPIRNQKELIKLIQFLDFCFRLFSLSMYSQIKTCYNV